MFRTGLLVVSTARPLTETSIGQILRGACEHVNNNLYVYLTPPETASTETSTSPQQHVALTKSIEQSVLHFYTRSASLCSHVDIRVILANIGGGGGGGGGGQQTHKKLNLLNQPEVLLMEKKCDQSLLDYVKARFSAKLENVRLVELDVKRDNKNSDENFAQTYDNTCLGGTFDRLHVGHKILLTKACLLTKKALTVGVTDGKMNMG